MTSLTSLSLLAAAAAWLASPAQAAALAPAGDLATWSCVGACGLATAQGDITASPLGHAQQAHVSTFGSAATGVSPLALDSNSRGSGTETNGSRLLSPLFQAAAGDTLSMYFNYVSTDGKGFDDYAWARLLNADGSLAAWLFTARSSNSSTRNIVPGGVVDNKAFEPRDVIVNYDSFSFTSKTVDDPVDWALLGVSNGSCWKDNAAGCGFTGWLHSQITLASAGAYRVELGVVNWGDQAYDSGLVVDYAGLQAAAVPEPGSAALALAGLAGLAAWRRR